MAKECKISFPGGNTQPGRKWFEAFLRRHPDIASRTSQNLTTRRLDVTQESIDKWFTEVENYLKINKLEEVLCHPKRVFNCDESAFFLNPKPGKVLAEKGSKKIYTAAGADEKLNLTVLLTANAAGEIAPPMIVYKYNRIPQQLAEAMPADWCIGKSENGWMTQETFYEYITNIFEPYLTKQGIQRPVILFMDGHSSHLSLPLSTFCINHGIEMVALIPNATHLIQPMDVAVFHTLKTSWRQEVANFRINHDGLQVQKFDFPQVLKAALQHVTPEIIINGFIACGLVPWNPKKVIVARKQKAKEMTPQKRHNEMVSFFKILEEKIGEDKLTAFKSNVGEWNGPVEQSELYKLWVETKQDLTLHKPLIISEPQSQVAPINSIETTSNEATIVTEKESAVLDDNLISEPLNTSEPVAGPSNVVKRQEPPVLKENSFSGTLNTFKPVAGTSNVPSPFKRAFFWPEDKISKVKQRKTREKLPAVVTSPQMIQYFKKKDEEKRSLEALKEQRKIEREERKKEAKEKKGKKRKIKELSPEPSSSENYSSEEEPQHLPSETESEDEGDPILETTALQEGKFVLVCILGGKRNTQKYIYLCVIQEMKENVICVQGLRSTGNKKDFIIKENDVFDISFSDIIGLVAQPHIKIKDRQLVYTFDKKLKVKEKL